MACTSDGSRVFDLLRQLEREYEIEVEKLTSEIESLRAKLLVAGMDASTPSSSALPALESEAEKIADDAPAICPGTSGNDLKHANVKIKLAWATRGADLVVKRSLSVASLSQPLDSRRRTRALDIVDLSMSNNACIPFSPTSVWRTFWDIIGLVMVVWDMIIVPLSVYDRPQSDIIDAIDKVILVFWTFDMLMSFFTGYWDAGQLVMKMDLIVPHYLKTWFVFDVVIVVPDWIVLATSSREVSYSRLLRSTRFVRVLRLLRITKLQRILNKFYDMIDNEHTFIAAELFKMLSFIVALNHIIACGWFLMGKLGAADGFKSWITWAEDYTSEHWAYQYATSLHWSLTQFTPASMDVVARNMYERVYSIFILFFAIVSFSSIVGTVTASMTILRGMKNDKQKSFWILRRYLKQERISSGLQQRLIKFVNHQVTKQETRVQRVNVRVLTHISTQLSAELAHEMYSPLLCNQPILNYICKEFETVGFRLCHSALTPVSLASADVLFSIGEVGKVAYIIKVGDLHYQGDCGAMLASKGEFLAEAVLWVTKWRYCGSAHAHGPCELLAVDEREFVETVCAHEVPWMFAKTYGEQFIEYLNSPDFEETDLIRDESFFAESVEYAKQALHTQSAIVESLDRSSSKNSSSFFINAEHKINVGPTDADSGGCSQQADVESNMCETQVLSSRDSAVATKSTRAL